MRFIPKILFLSFLMVICFHHQGFNQTENKDFLMSELKVVDGRPTLFINGVRHDGLFCSVRSPFMQNFIDAGFDIFDTHPSTPHGWVGDDEYDYTETDAYIEAYLKQKPDAKLILRFWFGYPRNFWWAVKHADHQTIPMVRDKGRKMPSYASLKWRQETGEALRRVIAHCEEKYGNNIVAYVPGGGSCGEWFQWYTFTEDADRFTHGYEMGDYSEPMQKAFRNYAKGKYGTVQKMNAAYQSNYTTFEELPIPEPESRLNARLGHLRDISKEKSVIDYYEVFNREVLETLVHFANMAKQGCDRRKVVMVFYGYHTMEQPRGGVSHARAGHVHVEEALSCTDIDYIVGPYHYCFRQLEGVISNQGVVASAIRRGKQYVQEIDCSTYLKPSWPCEDHHNPTNAYESGQILRRDMSKSLMEGASLWFMDLFQGMYDSPEMVAELKRALEVGRKHYFQSGKNDRQVAVVFHSRDAFYQREGEPLRAALIPQFKQFNLERMGMGYDDLMLENLKYLSEDETSQYKFWIFPTAVRLSDDEIELIQKHCLRNNNHVLWVYGPGVLSNKGIDLKRMTQLTGFEFGVTMEAGELTVRTTENKHTFLSGRKSPIVFGTYGEPSPDFIRYHSSLRHYPGSDVGFSVTPRFYIQNADVVLGHVLDIESMPAGLGVKQMDDWVSVYSAAPMVPQFILQNIAREAGCHVFTDFPGQTYQSEGYVGFFAHEMGDAVFHLPYIADVMDVFQEKVLFENVEQFILPVQLNQAVLLNYTKSKAE